MAQLCLSSSLSLFSRVRASISISSSVTKSSTHLRQSHKSLSLSSHVQRRSLCMASAEGAETATATATAPPPAAEPATPNYAEVGKLLSGLELRVGRILKAWKHPEADSLYVEEVDCGEAEGPRTICSGLVKYIPEEDMQNRLVVVLANLKPRNMRGIKSNGMLLAASDASHETVELLEVPEGAAPGERIWFGGEGEGEGQEAPVTANQLQKKKIWEAVQPLLRTTEDCVAAFGDKPLRVSAGPITCKSLKTANIG